MIHSFAPIFYVFGGMMLVGIGMLLGAALNESEHKRAAKRALPQERLMEVVES